MVDERKSFDEDATRRVIVFSDAVVAIAITLLALDLPVPDGHTIGVFWSSVRDNSGHYLAFLISFAVIAGAWIQHHRVFRYLERSDSHIVSFNMVWLLTIVLIPFATKMLTSQGHDDLDTHAVQFGFYALLQVVAYAMFLALAHRMVSRGLQTQKTPPSLLSEARVGCYGAMLGFGLSIPLLFATRWGWVMWGIGPVVVHRMWKLSARRRRIQT
jgi:uncharacterized membrane protein